MAFWDRWISRKALTAADLHLALLAEAGSKTGIRVTWETALQASTALSCARVIAEGIAQVPLKLHRARAGGGSDLATDHPLYNVVSTAPNPYVTSFEWRETAGMHLAVANRSYALINRAGNVRSQRVELWPLQPQNVRTERGSSGQPRYFVRMDESRDETEVAADAILHLRGPSWNGLEGLDGVKLAREAIGLSLATEEHGARLFKNGAILGGVLSTDQNLGVDQRKALRESWQDAQGGLGNAYKTAVLWGGMKWTPRAQQNDQAQWIEVRRFQVQEVCRFFRVLPIVIGEADKTATYASSEQMFLAHAVHTMSPWYRRIEDRLNLQLLTQPERDAGFYFKFNLNALLRGSHADRAGYYNTMRNIGALSANEIRALEEMNPYEGGDQYLRPLNMAPAETTPAAVDQGNP